VGRFGEEIRDFIVGPILEGFLCADRAWRRKVFENVFENVLERS